MLLQQPFDPGGHPELGSLLRGAICQIEIDQVSSAISRAIPEGNVGYCGVRLNWPRKLGTTE